MPEQVTDQRLREMTADALRLYDGFEEIYLPLIVEAVMRNLPPEFARERVERIVSESM